MSRRRPLKVHSTLLLLVALSMRLICAFDRPAVLSVTANVPLPAATEADSLHTEAATVYLEDVATAG